MSGRFAAESGRSKTEWRPLSTVNCNHLLDSVIDRFGTKNASYSKVDDEHFSVSVEVELSNQFYSWLLQFGEKARIMHPHYVVQEMKKFLDRMCTFYDYYIS